MATSKIVHLEVANFKRIREVALDVDGSVVVGGNNAQGKSSLLDAVWAGLVGGAAIPADPVRHGEDKATIRLTLDNGITVERTVTPDRKGKLKLTGAPGGETPQRWLDKHLSTTTLDPLALLALPPQKKGEMLRAMVGVDTSDIDKAKAEAFEARRDAKRELAALEARRAAAGVPEDAPDDPVDVAGVSDRLANLLDQQRANASARDRLSALATKARDMRAEIERIEAMLEAKRRDLSDLQAEGRRAKAEVEAQPSSEALDAEVAEARRLLSESAEINDAVRRNAQRQELVCEVGRKSAEVAALEDLVAECERVKTAMLDEAKWPLPGLSVADGGVTYNGVPLEQASQAEQLRVCVALAAATKPDIGVVLVREGCRLDGDGLALLLKIVNDAGLQAFVERVGAGDLGAIVIEDGGVK